MTALAMTVLIGTYTGEAGPAGTAKGVYAADWDDRHGALGPVRLVAELENPTFLAAHPALPLVYAVSEVERFRDQPTGAVAAYRVADGRLDPAGEWPSHGGSPCHVSLDARGEFLVLANYGGGTAGVWPLAAGLPTGDGQRLAFTGKGPDPEGRQDAPHIHSAIFQPASDRFWVQDLGSDRLWGFTLDRPARRARPLDPAATALPPGAGPRHLTFHPNGRWAYVIDELDSTVIALSVTDSGLVPFQIVPTLPAGTTVHNDCADLHLSPDGRFLYGSNRGHDSLAVWKVGPDGRLVLVEHVPSGGGHPRNFTLSPDGGWLLCANRDADNIVIFRRDPDTGRLGLTREVAAPHPVCLLFVPRR